MNKTIVYVVTVYDHENQQTSVLGVFGSREEAKALMDRHVADTLSGHQVTRAELEEDGWMEWSDDTAWIRRAGLDFDWDMHQGIIGD